VVEPVTSLSATSAIDVPLLVVITGQKCTLRCRDCGNFTPYQPQAHYSLDAICDDFGKLADVACVSTVQIQGGEALIFPGLVQLLDTVRPASLSITVATNGTRLLSQEQVEAIKRVRAGVRVSDYEISQQRIAELIAQCEANGIPFHLYRFAGGSGSWMDMGGRYAERNGDIETQEVFRTCPFTGCLTLEDGVIARCSRATVSHYAQNFVPNEADFVRVRELDPSQLRLSLLDYIQNPIPMEACRYCRGGMGQEIPPAIQLKGQASS
jgi:hypothetical protein